MYEPPVASTVRTWIASTGSTDVPCRGEPFAKLTRLACGLSPLTVSSPTISLSWFVSLWTLIVSLPAPPLINVWLEILLTSTRSLPAPVFTRTIVPTGVSSMVKWLLPGPRFSSRCCIPWHVIPPGSLAPTGPPQALASSLTMLLADGPAMQRLAPMPKPVTRNFGDGSGDDPRLVLRGAVRDPDRVADEVLGVRSPGWQAGPRPQTGTGGGEGVHRPARIDKRHF